VDETTTEAPVQRELTKDEKQIEEIFTYHPPTEDQHPAYEAIRLWGRSLASIIVQYCPPCADRSAAIRKVREAVMTANAAVALRGQV
jgi:hypothetical protein